MEKGFRSRLAPLRGAALYAAKLVGLHQLHRQGEALGRARGVPHVGLLGISECILINLHKTARGAVVNGATAVGRGGVVGHLNAVVAARTENTHTAGKLTLASDQVLAFRTRKTVGRNNGRSDLSL